MYFCQTPLALEEQTLLSLFANGRINKLDMTQEEIITKINGFLVEEFEVIVAQRFTEYFLKIRRVLDLNADIPHMTRGSAGSSLVCWLLGISDLDPVAENIPIARFMNPKRDDLPDIDLDFPHWQQITVMNRIFKRWPGQSARVSNYVMYKEKSARREAAKRLGATGKLKRDFAFEDVVPDYVDDAERLANKLLGKKRCISKHCGGILIFDRPVPRSLINGENQILHSAGKIAPTAGSCRF